MEIFKSPSLHCCQTSCKVLRTSICAIGRALCAGVARGSATYTGGCGVLKSVRCRSCAGGCAEGAGDCTEDVGDCAEGDGGCAEGAGDCAEGAGGCALYAESSEWCAMCAMGAGGQALYVVLYAVLYAILYAALCAALCTALCAALCALFILEAVEGELRLLEVLLCEL